MAVVRKLKVRVAKDVLVKRVAGESVVLNLSAERYLGFDSVGTRMWEVLTTANSVEEAAASLLEEFEVERDRLFQDLERFILELKTHGLVEVEEI